MLELTQKYFREDLTEAEEQALSDALRDSVDEAEDFVKLAEEAYYRYGFSTPRWPDPPKTPGGAGLGFQPWTGLFILVLGVLAAFWAWNHRRVFLGGHFPAGEIREGNSHAAQRLSKGVNQKPLSSGGEWPKPQAARGLLAREGLDGGKISPETGGMTGPRVPESPMVTPINLEDAPSRKYSSISMRVNLAEPASLAVRVLDTRGLEVTPLYKGNLGAGHWLFEWDGKLGNGRHASSGYYQIEVRAGSFVQRKNLEIR